jgi:hypothetical protein
MADTNKTPQDAHEQMVRRRFAELDKGNFAVLDEMFDPGYRLNFPTATRPLSLEATKRFYRALYAAFPDLTHTITEQISARDKVVTRWFAQGTHRGSPASISTRSRTASSPRATCSGISWGCCSSSARSTLRRSILA